MIVPEALLDLHRIQHAELLGDRAVRRARAAAGRSTVGSLGSVEPAALRLRLAFVTGARAAGGGAAATMTAVGSVLHGARTGDARGVEPDCCAA